MTLRLFILGIPVDAHTYDTWLAQIGEWIKESASLRQVCTVNPEFIIIAQKDPVFFHLLRHADTCIPDGIGIMLAARWLRQPLPARVTGSDGIYKIAARAAEAGWRLYFLGAAPGIGEKAADILRVIYPGVQIVGTSPTDPTPENIPTILEHINQSGVDILLVAYGAPKQDIWIDTYRAQLQVKVAIGVGGAFDFVAGVVPRAPDWMKKTGMEWLFRLYKQPWRWRRMLRLPLFVLNVLLYGTKPTPSARRFQENP